MHSTRICNFLRNALDIANTGKILLKFYHILVLSCLTVCILSRRQMCFAPASLCCVPHLLSCEIFHTRSGPKIQRHQKDVQVERQNSQSSFWSSFYGVCRNIVATSKYTDYNNDFLIRFVYLWFVFDLTPIFKFFLVVYSMQKSSRFSEMFYIFLERFWIAGIIKWEMPTVFYAPYLNSKWTGTAKIDTNFLRNHNFSI